MDKPSDKGNFGLNMSANKWGDRFSLTSFGESHGSALGVVIDGCPSGLLFDHELLKTALERRRPGSKKTESARQEQDVPEILSGVFEGRTLGTPIAVIVKNQDAQSKDYEETAKNPRPGHADDVWKDKFLHSDPRGGGRSSGRETLSRVIAGAIAQMLVRELSPSTKVIGFASAIGPFKLPDSDREKVLASDHAYPADSFTARFPSQAQNQSIEDLLLGAKVEGKSFGGIAEILILNPPKNLGQPVFHKLKAELASAFMGVGAATAFELGEGFAGAEAEGSEFHRRLNSPYGGIRGGISTGDSIHCKVAFKPTSSVMDVAKKGRHDPCIVPRAIPVLEAMAWLVLAEQILWARCDRI